MPTATIGASSAINASNGKVIFGTATDSVTIEKGTLASVNGLASVTGKGLITLAWSSTNGATLTLADGGTLTTTGDATVTVAGSLKIEGETTLTSTGQSVIAAATGTTATLTTAATANNGIQIGSTTDGIALLAIEGTAMVYTFTAANGSGTPPVSISGAYITAPAAGSSGSAGAIIAATTDNKARIVLGTASGGIKLGQGTSGGQFTIASSSGGCKIGPFASNSNADGYLNAAVGVTGTAGQAAAKVLLGTFSNSSGDGQYFCTTASAAVTVIGATGSGEAEINSGLVLVDDE
jgi:hypothetical protein